MKPDEERPSSPNDDTNNVNEEPDPESPTTVVDRQTQQNFVSKLSQFAFIPSPNSPLRLSPVKLSARGTETPDLKTKNEDDGTVAVGLKRALEDDEDVLPSIPQPSSSSSPPKKKKKKPSRGLASPEMYAHLNSLDDNLKVGLDVMFCGINPGVLSGKIGHHFGNPTNHFWACLHDSGLTSKRLKPPDDHTLPDKFNLGLTNLVERVTAEQNELSKSEQIAGVPALLRKIAHFRPRIVCFIGLGIATIVTSQLFKSEKKVVKTSLGLQPYKMRYRSDSSPITETIFFAVSSTSGRVVAYQKVDKVKQFQELKRVLDEVKLSSFDSSGLVEVVAPGPLVSRFYREVKEVDEEVV
ncbi:uracil-DNA glycosylase-like protein [Cyathus striatus]|nr:uracil-DNA glycosylase-like protein [Cyathus striatus]